MKRKYIVILSLLCICILLSPYWFALLHVHKLKRDLDNPIINQHYHHWHKVSLDENIEIKLPDTWFIDSGQQSVICDDSGTAVALGMREEIGEDKDSEFLQLLSDCAGCTVTDYTIEYFGSSRFGNSASVYWMICKSDTGQEEKVTCIYLPYRYQYRYYFCFIGDAESYCDIAEAIAWSLQCINK